MDERRARQAAHTTHKGQISAGGVERDVTFEHTGEERGDAIDAGYREKYGRYSGYEEPMVAPQAPLRLQRFRGLQSAGAASRPGDRRGA